MTDTEQKTQSAHRLTRIAAHAENAGEFKMAERYYRNAAEIWKDLGDMGQYISCEEKVEQCKKKSNSG